MVDNFDNFDDDSDDAELNSTPEFPRRFVTSSLGFVDFFSFGRVRKFDSGSMTRWIGQEASFHDSDGRMYVKTVLFID